MRLRTRLTIIIGFTWFLFCSVVYVGTNFYLLKNIKKQEHQEFLTNLSRVEKGLNQYLNNLGTLTSDWAYWNDAYDYIAGVNSVFISDNINLLTLQNLKVNMLIYLNKKGQILIGVITNISGETLQHYPINIENYIYPGSLLEEMQEPIKNIKGLMHVDNSIMLVASSAVANTDKSKPINGVLIMGRYFTNKLLDMIASDTELKLSLFLKDACKKKTRLNEIINRTLQDGESQYIYIENNDLAHGYVVLRDIYKSPIGVIQVDMPRLSYQSGLHGISYYLFMLFFLGALLCMLIWFLLKSFILDQVETLTKKINEMNEKSDYTARLSVKSNDEFSLLAEHFNKMMATMELSSKQREEHIKNMEMSQDRLEAMNKRLINEVNERKQAESKVKILNDNLMMASRRAGMADIANSVLQSVGGYLSSIVTSVGSVKHILENVDNKNPASEDLLNEANKLEKNIISINKIIFMQDSLCNLAEVTEEIKLSRVLEDAIAVTRAGCKKNKIKVIRDFKFVENVVIDRVKLLYIIVSLFKCAKHSLIYADVEQKTILITSQLVQDRNFSITITDNSHGISPENISKILSHGFATEQGLDSIDVHTGVVFAKDMGGTVTIENLEMGQGTKFSVILPITPIN